MNYQMLHRLQGHSGPVYTILFHGGSHSLYSGSSDGLVAKWNISDGEALPFLVKVGKPVFSLLIHHATLLVGQGEGGIHAIDLNEKREVRHLQYHRLGVFAMMVVEKESIVLSCGGDGRLCILDASDYRLLHEVMVSAMKLRCVALDSDQSRVLIGGSDGFVRIFDSAYFNELYALKAHEGGVYSICQLSKTRWITGGRDAHLRIWELVDNELHAVQAVPAHNYAIYSVAKSHSENLLATASRDKSVKVWSPGNFSHPDRLDRLSAKGHTHSVNAVAFDPDSALLVSGSDDRNIIVWEPLIQ